MTKENLHDTTNSTPDNTVPAIRDDFYAPFASGAAFADIGPDYADEFQKNQPMQHAVIDDLFDDRYLDKVISEVPVPSDRPGFVKHDLGELQSNKYAYRDVERLGPYTRTLIDTLNTKPFLEFLTGITGIKALISDCYLGGGFQQTARGGKLGIHADFATHPITGLDRRINMLIFLNRDWHESYGGYLELWDAGMTQCVRRYPPAFNKTVIFATTDHAFHGHPEPLNCPPTMTRKSLCLFYYTNGRPEHELSALRSDKSQTLWQERPQDVATESRD